MLLSAALALPSTSLFVLALAWAFATGAALGSFLGLVVDRLPRHESIVSPRSRCQACKHQLTIYDMVPIFSWLWLWGRCRRCKVAIGARALWTECAMGGLSAALVAQVGFSAPLLTWWPLCGLMLAIALLDIDWFWVPDALSVPAMVWALLTCWLPGNIGLQASLLGLLPAACLYAFAALYERLAQKEGLGFGDIKLLAVIGLGLGPLPALLVLTAAALLGAIVGSVALAVGGHAQASSEGTSLPVALADDAWVAPPSAVPFGPFLVLACYGMVLAPQGMTRMLLWLPERLAMALA